MHTRKIGPFEVSAIGLGCMNISMGYGDLPDETTAAKLLNAAIDAGYTFMDTAAMYGMGHSETMIGKHIMHRRSEFTLASKCGIFRNSENQVVTDGRPEIIVQTCEDSLRRLNTEVIDLYYLHRVDKNVPVEDSIGTLGRLAEQGKIRTVGMSEIASDTLRKAHATFPITAVQSEYSLWTRTPERKIIETCRELGIAFVPFSPLARQFLTGKCKDVTELTKNDIRCTNSRPRFEPENFSENIKLLGPYRAIAERCGCTMAQLALAWVLAQGEDMIPIPGTKNIEHMEENAGAGDIKLDKTTVNELDQLINDKTVKGDRYNEVLMNTIDSERD
ncbi:MAG: aldo/keto reductase [Acidiferrobacterales bacterium]|nr:aldo/keto reductase [Acidiferrobacterales bacterium]